LIELSDSIQSQGVLVPILVTKNKNKKDSYLIIAGERRWRASKLAKLDKIKAIVISNNDEKTNSLVSIIENVQRENLSTIEEAEAYNKLINDYSMKHEDLAKSTGKSRSYITNLIRILGLNPKVKKLLANGSLSFGHARALLSSKDQDKIAKTVIENNLSVRETEDLIKSNKNPNTINKLQGNVFNKLKDPNILDYEKYLSLKLGYKVEIKDKSGKGYLLVRYKSLDQLDTIVNLFNK
jgi:ParB family chromosome partitioning protein